MSSHHLGRRLCLHGLIHIEGQQEEEEGFYKILPVQYQPVQALTSPQ